MTGDTTLVVGVEALLADVLAEVMEIEEVPVSGHFFDDLGADSMTMAHFCARLSKRVDLPTVSIKQVYQHPTIESLAAATSTEREEAAPLVPDREPPAEPVATTPAAVVGTWQYVLCGALQILTIVELAILAAVVAVRGYEWISAVDGLLEVYARSAVFAGSVFVGWSLLPIILKWVLVGRWEPGRLRIWSLGYVGFWFVKLALQAAPMRLFVGTPLYNFYLRALGAKVGRGVIILSGSLPVCADLLTIGDDAVIRRDSSFTCYRARGGFIEMGPVTLGRDTFVGEATVLDIETTLGDGAQVGHASALYRGQVLPAGEHRIGTPATQRTEIDHRAVARPDRAVTRRFLYSVGQLLLLFGVTLPVPAAIGVALARWRITPDNLLGFSSSSLGSGSFYVEAAAFSLVVFFGATILRLLFVCTVPRVLNRAIEANRPYPLYGIRYACHRAIGRWTNVRFFTNLFGDSSYVVNYLSWLGYGVSFEEQTGANFGLNVRHENPYHVTVGPGTMAADGLSVANAEYSSTAFRVPPVEIGAHSFIGNQVVYPPSGRTGENCLHASKVAVPATGPVRENVGYLGSPSFEIPRLVFRDQKFDSLKEGDEFERRLAAKNRNNLATMVLLLLSRWGAWFIVALLGFAAADLYTRFGVNAVAITSAAGLVLVPLYLVLVERLSIGFARLQPLYCSMYEPASWTIERYWKLSWQPAVLNGTPVKSVLWRLLGVRVGRRLFDDGALLIEKTMITVGDDCVLNAASVIQPHSQEDGTFKSDTVTIGDRCTLGINSLVHYGVTMEDGATLAPNAFLMKGTEVPAGTHWGDNPARELVAEQVAMRAERGA